VFSNDPEEYKHYILKVLKRLKAIDLYINRNKYEFYTTQVAFLGFIISPEGIIIELEHIEAIVV